MSLGTFVGTERPRVMGDIKTRFLSVIGPSWRGWKSACKAIMVLVEWLQSIAPAAFYPRTGDKIKSVL